ncbi:hypothetical protein [Providencia sp. TYF-12]
MNIQPPMAYLSPCMPLCAMTRKGFTTPMPTKRLSWMAKRGCH